MSSNLATAAPDEAQYYMPAPSFKGRMWKLPSFDRALGMRMSQAYGLPEMVGALLASRGVAFDEVEGFLAPNIRSHFPDPFKMSAMQAAADDVAAAIIAGDKIGIVADFDVDGATSSGILSRFLAHVGQKGAPIYIPDRLSEGYGVNAQAFDSLKEQGCAWVLVADSGTTAFEAFEHAHSIGINSIILDHHEAEATLPQATHCINPKRRDDTSGYSMLAACGVAFLFCVALNKCLRTKGHYGPDLPEPDLKQFLDLVALGTVCDMVPLLGPNRLFVRAGFARMAARDNVGIDALLQVGKIKDVPNTTHAGFVLGPRINAGSRVHESDLGARLLSTEDPDEAMRIAWLLDECNTKRRAMQKDMVAHAAARVKAFGYDNDAMILLDDPEWHPGLVGLVAGDMKERFGKPACIVGYANDADGNPEGRGSGRSVAGINIADAFIAARHEGLLVKGGGHAMAGGFTVKPDRIKDLRSFLNSHIGAQAANIPACPESEVDAVMRVSALNVETAKLVHGAVAPYGSGHAEPSFVLRDVLIMFADIVGNTHVRITMRDRDGGRQVKGIAFRAVGTPLGDFLLKEAKDSAVPVHLLGNVQLNVWQGRESAEFFVSDAYVGHVTN